MRKIFYCFVFIACVFASMEQVVDRYPSGSIKHVDFMKEINGKLEVFLSKEYFENGQLKYESRESNSHMDGAYTSYYESGVKRSTGKFKNGKMDGQWVFYRSSGDIIAKGRYGGGVDTDLFESYDYNLNNIPESMMVGGWYMYHQGGKIAKSFAFDSKGEKSGRYAIYFKSGKLLEKGSFRDGLLHGLLTTYNENGSIIYQIHFNNGAIDTFPDFDGAFHIYSNEFVRYYTQNKKDVLFTLIDENVINDYSLPSISSESSFTLSDLSYDVMLDDFIDYFKGYISHPEHKSQAYYLLGCCYKRINSFTPIEKEQNINGIKRSTQLFKKSIDKDGNYSGILAYYDPQSHIRAEWSYIALSYKLRSKQDSMLLSYEMARKDGGFDEYITDYAFNILKSCDQGAILFTNGDNDTFPLLYAQDYLGFRQDVKVINLSLLNASWYQEFLIDKYFSMRGSYTAIARDLESQGDLAYSYVTLSFLKQVPDIWDELSYTIYSFTYDLIKSDQRLMAEIKKTDPGAMVFIAKGKDVSDFNDKYSHYLLNGLAWGDEEAGVPLGWSDANYRLKIKGDKSEIGQGNLIASMSPTLGEYYIRVQDYLVLKIIENEFLDRSIYFATSVSKNQYAGLFKYTSLEGLVSRLGYEFSDDGSQLVNRSKIIENINKYKLSTKSRLTQSDLAVYANSLMPCVVMLFQNQTEQGYQDDLKLIEELFPFKERQQIAEQSSYYRSSLDIYIASAYGHSGNFTVFYNQLLDIFNRKYIARPDEMLVLQTINVPEDGISIFESKYNPYDLISSNDFELLFRYIIFLFNSSNAESQVDEIKRLLDNFILHNKDHEEALKVRSSI